MQSLAGIQKQIDENVREVDELIDTLQDTILKLQRRGYKLYDQTNEEYYLTGEVAFDKADMKFKLEFDKELM